jgi:hypothetical protein
VFVQTALQNLGSDLSQQMLVEQFYLPPLNLPDAITSVLAGPLVDLEKAGKR